MAICKSCSAPLSSNSKCCHYCGISNEVDVQQKNDYTITKQSEKICPVCHIPMRFMDLNLNGHFYIECCNACFGLFFDPGEIETLLESSVSAVFSVNWQLLDNINLAANLSNYKINYRKCPVCQVLMNRVSFGYQSGVVVDRCKNHGVWLDRGEIIHLLEWKKAGGQLWTQQQQQEKQDKNTSSVELNHDFSQRNSYPQFESDAEPDFLKTLSQLVFKLFE